MRALAHKAREIPALQNTFRRLYLNQWTEQAERWIDMAAWQACGGPCDWRALREAKRGATCVGGLDLSSRTDLSALVLFFDDESVVPFFWVPAEGAEKRAKTDRVPYPEWIRAGLITPTPGAVVDQAFIKADILQIAKTYRLREIAFDPWNATYLCTELQTAGLQVVELRQGFASLSEATKHLGALITGRDLQHGDHPVLRWMASNMVVRQDPNGNLAPDKGKASERVDGIVALIMAIAGSLKQEDAPRPRVLILGGR
jgi:phage terminase large subunit-like protein